MRIRIFRSKVVLLGGLKNNFTLEEVLYEIGGDEQVMDSENSAFKSSGEDRGIDLGMNYSQHNEFMSSMHMKSDMN
jgi:polygalacturonase